MLDRHQLLRLLVATAWQMEPCCKHLVMSESYGQESRFRSRIIDASRTRRGVCHFFQEIPVLVLVDMRQQ